MGDAVVSALVKEIVGRLTSEVIKEFALVRGLEDDILSLEKAYRHIQAVLQDAEEKHIKERAVELWLRDLKSASLMVENVLDEVSTEALLQHLHKQRVKYSVRAFFSSNHNKLMSSVKIAHKVQDIRKKLDDIAYKRFELKLTPSGVIGYLDDDMGVAGEMPNRETSSLLLDSSSIVGRKEDMEMVIEKICNKDIGKHENGEIRVYGIRGMGGMGKTTLAQLVYNNERVKQYFELRCWVYVSENFQVKEIIKKLIESIDKCGCTLTQLGTLQESLQSKLMGKKFLIVLDDVWIEEDEKAKWEELSKTLNCGAEGSIVMMTTRSSITSHMMTMVGELQHDLGCLSDDDSWLLFKKHAFAHGRGGDDMSELEPIGRGIVAKCKRLPLAVKTLGSLMWSKRSTSDWQHVKDNNIWELQENNILPAIKLSYDNLLPHLKRCFAYCCLFPKGHNMQKDEVIQLWVANGFIPPRGETDLYVIGEEVFNYLVWRSFFNFFKDKEMFTGRRFDEKALVIGDRYIMHDLMHDMARYVTRHDCLIIESGKKLICQDQVLHLSSSCPDLLFPPQESRNLKSLRSILIYGKKNEDNINQILNHRYLRVLYLCDIKLRTLPKSISKLKHLRYLNLSNSSLKVLPESIIYLQNLQVLLLNECNRLCKLPEGLRYMTNLEQLDIYGCDSLQHIPSGIKDLTNLRMLSMFRVSKRNGAKIEELGELNLLERTLWIEGLQNVGGKGEALSANLKFKTNLSSLHLSWSDREMFDREDLEGPEPNRERFSYDEEVLEGLEPNSCINELGIWYYMGKIPSPSWMVKLNNLVKITFMKCQSCVYIPSLDMLPNLREITLTYMESLKCFHDDTTNILGDTTDMFLSLQKLVINNCPKLVSLPSNLPKLKVFSLSGWNEFVSLRCNLPKLEVLRLWNSHKLVSLPQNIPNIIELELHYCGGFLSLPDEIQSYMNLKKLVIHECRHLSERCKETTGEDWHKISHIPNIRYNYTDADYIT